MDDSALAPPNSKWLSDSVIGDVMQRARPGRAFLEGADAHKREAVSYKHPRSVASTSARPDVNASLPPLSKMAPTRTRTTPLRQSSAGDVEARAPSTTTHQGDSQEVDKAIELRRERNRIHQARHKMRQRQLVTDLEDSIVQLREEIQELKLQRELIGRGVPTISNLWGVAAEFFRLFRHSVRPVESNEAERTPRRSHYNAQRDFMLATMMPDVTDGDVFGVDALLENWALQSLCFDDIDVEPVRMEKRADDALLASTQATLVISESTIRYAFPHLVDENGQPSPLVSKMLGQTLSLHGSVVFEWDAASNRVAGVYSRTDLLTPLLNLLGSLEDVACVFDKARITPEGRLVSNDDYQDHPPNRAQSKPKIHHYN